MRVISCGAREAIHRGRSERSEELEEDENEEPDGPGELARRLRCHVRFTWPPSPVFTARLLPRSLTLPRGEVGELAPLASTRSELDSRVARQVGLSGSGLLVSSGASHGRGASTNQRRAVITSLAGELDRGMGVD